MVRTGTARVSAGKSSKKGGGSAVPTPLKLGGNKSSASKSSALPPITHQETPEWQKPITTFFKSQTPLKTHDNESHTDNIPDELSEESITQENDNVGKEDKKKRHKSMDTDEGVTKKKRRFMNLDDSSDEELEKKRSEVQGTTLENKENVNVEESKKTEEDPMEGTSRKHQ